MDRVDGFGIPLMEMATIGVMGRYKFSVYTEPLKNPSFHVRHGNDFEVVLQINDLRVLEVKFNNTHREISKGEPLPADIALAVSKFLALRYAKDPEKTNRQAVVFAWQLLND